MAGTMTTAHKDAYLSVFRGTDLDIGTNVYIALFTASPTDSGSTTNEVSTSGTAYARQAVSVGTGSWDAPSDDSGARKILNTNAIAFPTATASWGTVTHVGIMTASSGGTMLHHSALDASKTIGNTDSFTLPIGSVKITAD